MASQHERDQRRNALRIAGVSLAELPAHHGFLDRELPPIGNADENDAEDGPPLADGQAGSGQGEQNSGIDRVADPAIGTVEDGSWSRLSVTSELQLPAIRIRAQIAKATPARVSAAPTSRTGQSASGAKRSYSGAIGTWGAASR